MENQESFELRVVAHLSSTPRIILRKNGASRRGFTGHRKPDLVTIESDLEFIVWELARLPMEIGEVGAPAAETPNDFAGRITEKPL